MVVYVVCVKLEDDGVAQMKQLSFWLQFLNSAIPQAGKSRFSKWLVMIVGLRADVKHPSSFL